MFKKRKIRIKNPRKKRRDKGHKKNQKSQKKKLRILLKW